MATGYGEAVKEGRSSVRPQATLPMRGRDMTAQERESRATPTITGESE